MGALGIFALIVLSTLVATVLAVVVWLAMLPGKIAAQREAELEQRLAVLESGKPVAEGASS